MMMVITNAPPITRRTWGYNTVTALPITRKVSIYNAINAPPITREVCAYNADSVVELSVDKLHLHAYAYASG
jgi:hypothetical protein